MGNIDKDILSADFIKNRFASIIYSVDGENPPSLF